MSSAILRPLLNTSPCLPHSPFLGLDTILLHPFGFLASKDWEDFLTRLLQLMCTNRSSLSNDLIYVFQTYRIPRPADIFGAWISVWPSILCSRARLQAAWSGGKEELSWSRRKFVSVTNLPGNSTKKELPDPMSQSNASAGGAIAHRTIFFFAFS